MTWRTVVIDSQCKLTYKNDYLVVRKEEVKMIHLSEIAVVIINTTAASITSYLLSELISKKIKVIFCDAHKNPQAELVSYFGAHNSSKKILNQINWNENTKLLVWTRIIKQKILNQADFLKYCDKKEWSKLCEYANQVEIGDPSNREGHSARCYFESLFGTGFNRDEGNEINAGLDYGYTILLSAFNREIVSSGYLTQLGMKHCNEYNQFNLSCDIMEPFRVIIDKIVYDHQYDTLNSEYKFELIDCLNKKVLVDDKEVYVLNAISLYTKSILQSIESGDIENVKTIYIL